MKKSKISLLFAGLILAGSVVSASAATGSLSVKDGSGAPLNDLSGATTVNAVLTIDGEITPDEGAKAYIAAYSSGKLVAIDDASVSENITFDALTLPGDETQTLKAFAWQGNLTPIIPVVTEWNNEPEEDEAVLTKYEIRGVPIAGNMLYFSYEGTATDEDIANYTWMQATTEAGEYTEVAGVNAPEYKSQDLLTVGAAKVHDWWVKVKVTLSNGNEYTTEPFYLYGGLAGTAGFVDAQRNWDIPANAKLYSNEDYVFEVDGQKFVMLDTIPESDTGRFLVIAENTYGIAHYGATGVGTTTKEGSVIAGLNDIEALLPSEIMEYTSADSYYTGGYQNWTLYAPGLYNEISIPSVYEINEYADILGMYAENYSTGRSAIWALRTPKSEMNSQAWYVTWGVKALEDGTISKATTYNLKLLNEGLTDKNISDFFREIRPIFYLDKSFLIEQVDYSTAAPAIKKFMQDTYTKDEMLAAGYTEDELRYFGESFEGMISDLSIALDEEKVVRTDYVFEGPDEIAEALSYQWKIADAENGTYSVIENATDVDFMPAIDMSGKYVKVTVLFPNGEKLESSPLLLDLHDAAYTKTLSTYAIRGILSSGNTLHFVYTSADGAADEDVYVKWYKSNALDGTYEDVAEGMTYTTTPVTANEYYYVVATLPSGVSYTTDKVTVTGYNKSNAYWPNQMVDNNLLSGGAWPRENNKETLLEYTASGLQTEGSELYFAGATPYCSEDYAFIVGGQTFILVDTVETSDTARYKVIADATYGKEKLDSTGLANVEARMPEAVTRHIDHTVWYEGSVDSFGVYVGSAVSGVYSLSGNDIKNYGNKIGLISYNYESGEPSEYILNANAKAKLNGGWMYVISSYDEEADVLNLRINGANLGADTAKYAEIRPVFYLDKDFFTAEADNIIFAGGDEAPIHKMIK